MQKKDGFVSIIKGFITGIASLVPGVSPSSCIVSFSSYENFIKGLSSVLKKEKNKETKQENKKILLLVTIPIIIGIIIGLISGNHLIEYFLGKYRPQTIFLFVGVITGGLTLTIKNNKNKKLKATIPTFLITLVISFVIYFILSKQKITIPTIILPTVSGLLTAIIILIPSISLSYIYSLLDRYNYIVSSALSLSNIKDVLVVLTFIVVLILSLILIAKLISYLLKKHKEVCYSVICAVMILSIVVMILKVGRFTISFVNIFTTILAFLWGYLLAKNVEKE